MAIGLFTLSGCASWFKPSPAELDPPASAPVAMPAEVPAVRLWPVIPDLQVAVREAAQATPSVFRDAVQVVERSADQASDRGIKEAALYEVVRYAAWAMGAGFFVFLLGGFLPIPGLRTAGASTVALGAAIATLAPWLNDLLGDQDVRLAGYAAFSILAIAFAAGGAWWFLDKVRDETRRRG